jgi:Polysaccharide lyase
LGIEPGRALIREEPVTEGVQPLLVEWHTGVSHKTFRTPGMAATAPGGISNFGLSPGQAKKNNGIRAEISVDYPYKVGDVVRHAWKMRLPDDFKADDPQNRWWVMGQWHDQPDRTLGETWAGFPGRSLGC